MTEHQALARAAATIHDADRLPGAPPAAPASDDGTGDLAEHTAAVLAAYRELTRTPGPGQW